MGFNLDKLTKIAKPRSEEELEQARIRKENKEWIRISQDIALNIHFYLKQLNISQKELALRMGVTPPYIGKLLKGKENMTIETICKLQTILNKELIAVLTPKELKQTVSKSSMTTFVDSASSIVYSDKGNSFNEYLADVEQIA
ncbi:MAG: helix-turn-helix domain-containing protein [Bacteroidales bacterium]